MDEEPDELNGTLFANATIGARRDAARCGFVIIIIEQLPFWNFSVFDLVYDRSECGKWEW